MVKKTIFVFVLLLSLLLISVHAEEKDCISYFYGEDCQGCEQVNAHLNSLQTQYPGLQIQKFEVYYNPDNLQTLRDYFTAYKISQEKQVVPSIFVSGSYFVGTQPILDLLEQRIGDNTNEACPTLTDKWVVGVAGNGAPVNVLKTLTFSRVTGSAFANSFSISAFAILSILFLLVITLKDKDEMMKKGFIFIGGVYLSYFLFSLGLFSWFATAPFSILVLKIIGLIVIILALTQVKDFLDTLKPLLRKIHAQRWLQKMTDILLSSPGIFFLGFILTLFTFHLANDTLLMMRHLYVLDIGRITVVPLILYHLFLIMLRPAFLILLVYFIRQKLYLQAEKKAPHDPLNIQKWYWHYIKVFNFILAIIVILFGLGLLFT
ncbi:MAG: hypothetical protein Q7K45_02005 [Nanoarchaeota archaeon]|nr:hypothetical protein [Nanoarchaeota archaeon]